MISKLSSLFGRTRPKLAPKPLPLPVSLPVAGPSTPLRPDWSAPPQGGSTTKPASKLQLPSKSKTETLDPVFYLLSDEDIQEMPMCERSADAASKA